MSDITKETIGPADPAYKGSGFTEILLRQDGAVFAHFWGPWARVYANQFLLMKEQELSQLPDNDNKGILKDQPIVRIGGQAMDNEVLDIIVNGLAKREK